MHAAYVDNGDGTVTDTVTGLMWDKCPYGQTANDCSGDSAIRFTWAQALAQTVGLNGINYKGHNDWRLPSIRELESLVKIGLTNPTIDDVAFPNTRPDAVVLVFHAVGARHHRRLGRQFPDGRLQQSSI